MSDAIEADHKPLQPEFRLTEAKDGYLTFEGNVDGLLMLKDVIDEAIYSACLAHIDLGLSGPCTDEMQVRYSGPVKIMTPTYEKDGLKTGVAIKLTDLWESRKMMVELVRHDASGLLKLLTQCKLAKSNQ